MIHKEYTLFPNGPLRLTREVFAIYSLGAAVYLAIFVSYFALNRRQCNFSNSLLLYLIVLGICATTLPIAGMVLFQNMYYLDWIENPNYSYITDLN